MTIHINTAFLWLTAKWFGILFGCYFLIGLALALLLAAAGGGYEKSTGKELAVFALTYGWAFLLWLWSIE